MAFIGLQRRQAGTIRGMNKELETANEFLASVSMKISRYLSPQIYKSIFSGQKDVTIHTERKKLTIFFSDIKDFTATTERLQPEQITALLNEYFTEMSAIALQHGGTIDKFIGDAMLIFFGDPETKGEARGRRGLPAHGLSRCSGASPSSMPNGAPTASSSRSACAWASIPASAMSAISAATTAWTIRSSAPKRTSPRGCNRSPSPARSCSATRPMRWCATSLRGARRCRRSR